jgi:hypothetical protein
MTPILKRMGLTGILCGSMALGACSTMMHTQTWSMDTASIVPAAKGEVKVANEKDGNTKVKVEVEHLAPAPLVSDVEVPGSTYVVWIKPTNGPAQNVGVLDVGKDRKGKLDTKTPYKEFRVYVTLERSPAVTFPRGERVLDTRITMPT